MNRRHLMAACAAVLAAGTIQAATTSLPSAAAEAGRASAAARFDTGRLPRLSPRLAELAGSELRGDDPRQQARALSLPVHGAGSLMRRGDRVVVEILMSDLGSDRVSALRAAGARIEHVSHRYATVTAAVALSALPAISAVGGVRHVGEVLTPMLAGRVQLATGPKRATSCPQGAADSEGDTQLRADLERAQLHGTGDGITVGVLSDSYDRWSAAVTHAAGDVLAGDLPGAANPCGETAAVNVLDDSDASGEDEGRGMLQIVHDLAPDAHLAFATALTSETAFADNIRKLAQPVNQGGAGAKVIVDDVTYFDEPFYQDGPVADAVNDVTAAGVVYYSSAANNNVISGGKDVGSWEAPAYRPTACPASVAAQFTDCMDFNPGSGADNTYGVTLKPNAKLRLELQWAEPWYGLKDDLHLALLNASGASVVGNFQNNGITPFISFLLSNVANSADYNIVIGRPAGSTGTPRVKLAFLQNGAKGAKPNEYTQSTSGDVVGPTIFGHNGGANTISVAAVPFDDPTTAEVYSSRGPVTHYFAPVNGTTPAPPLASPQVLAKPDLAATDCGMTTFFLPDPGPGPPYRFCGTSAAAPHAAAIAALELSLVPNATRDAVLASQTSTARAVGSFGHTAVGAGLIDALGATQRLTTPPTATMTKPKGSLQLGRKIALAWSSTDTGTGVKDYTVQVAKARYDGTFGSYSAVPGLTDTTKRSARVTEAYGATYCFRVSARDQALNVSPSSAARCIALPVDDRTAKTSSGWSKKKGPTPSKTLSVSHKKGATLTLKHVHARRVGVVVRTCKRCGSLKLSFGGKKLGTVHLASKHPKTVVAVAKAFGRVKTGTLKVTVSTKGKKVQVDGFVDSQSAKMKPVRGRALRVQT